MRKGRVEILLTEALASMQTEIKRAAPLSAKITACETVIRQTEHKGYGQFPRPAVQRLEAWLDGAVSGLTVIKQ
jgi:hypothetical protein